MERKEWGMDNFLVRTCLRCYHITGAPCSCRHKHGPDSDTKPVYTMYTTYHVHVIPFSVLFAITHFLTCWSALDCYWVTMVRCCLELGGARGLRQLVSQTSLYVNNTSLQHDTLLLWSSLCLFLSFYLRLSLSLSLCHSHCLSVSVSPFLSLSLSLSVSVSFSLNLCLCLSLSLSFSFGDVMTPSISFAVSSVKTMDVFSHGRHVFAPVYVVEHELAIVKSGMSCWQLRACWGLHQHAPGCKQ